MGINDPDKVIEAFLASIAPRAFFYRLPKGFSSNLIFRDLSSLMVMAFSSLAVKSGHDFVQRLVDYVTRFVKLTNERDHEGEIDFQDGCSFLEGSNAPTLDEIEEWRKDMEHDRFDGCAHSGATLVMVRDSAKFMPVNRDMVHEARYGGESTNIRDQPFSEEEIRQRTLHVCAHRPLPGVTNDMELLADASIFRNRANRTTCLRQAYQNYGPWALSRWIEKMTGDYLAGGSPTKRSRPNIERRVIIDAVLADFPKDYENTELCDLPDGWAGKHKEYECHIHSLGVHNQAEHHVTKMPVPNIGEADRKIIHYIDTHSKEGDNVLICSNDSDILFILLSNMHRYRTEDSESPWSRTIFLDMNTPNMKKERYTRRFVCMNILAEELDKYAKNHWSGMENAAQVITIVALLCGSDYIKNPRGIGATKILECFKSGGWTDLCSLVRLGQIDIVNHHPRDASVTKNWEQLTRDLDLVLVNVEALDQFMRRLYQTRLTQKSIKQYGITTASILSWKKLEHYLEMQDRDKKQAAELKVPSDMERDGEMRRVMWNIHYWMTSHLNLGDFPAPDLDDPESGKSVWGWSRTRPSLAHEHNGERFLNRDRVSIALKQMLELESNISSNTGNKQSLYSSSEKYRQWVCSKNNDIVEFNDIWHLLLAEFVVRARDRVVRFRTPLWQ